MLTVDEITYAAKTYLWAFVKLASGFQAPKHIRYIADTVTVTVSRKSEKHKLLIITAPPRHGKSELIPVHAPAFLLGHFPRFKIIIATYAASLAHRHSAKARDLCNFWGKPLWGIQPSETCSARDLWGTSEGGEVKAVGLEGGLTGFGADVLIIDDYHASRKEAESQLQRNNVWEWWQSVASTRLHPSATVIIFATRWHEDDLIGRLLKEAEAQKEGFPFEMEYINLPAIAEKDDLIGRVEGEALWPWWFNVAQLSDIQKTVGSYEWSALYQGRPANRGGTLFKREYFRYFDFDYTNKTYRCWRPNVKDPIIVRGEDLTCHVYCDPALEIKTINDPSAAAAWAYSRKHKIWLLLDRMNSRIEHTQILSALKSFAFKNKCAIIGVENEKLGKVLVKQSAGNDEIGGRKIPFVEVPTGGLDKYARATPMAGYIENERVFFPKSAPWLAEYENSLVQFPLGKHDEDVDITSMAERMEERRNIMDVFRR